MIIGVPLGPVRVKSVFFWIIKFLISNKFINLLDISLSTFFLDLKAFLPEVDSLNRLSKYEIML